MGNKPNIILVTRPLPAGKELCDEIQKEGGNTLLFPTIDIQPKTVSEDVLKELPQQEWIIFISPQSVYNSHFSIPKHVKIAAIGEGTAKALHAAHFTISAKPKDEWNTEGLLALPQFQDIKNKKITIVRGVGGREDLAQQLESRGALVTHAITYERNLPSIDVSVAKQLLSSHRLSVCVCTSKTGLVNLKELLQSAWVLLKGIPIVVISARMQTAAKELGFENIILAENASHHSIITVLKERGFMENSKNPQSTASGEKSGWGSIETLITAFAIIILFGGFYIANMRVLHTQNRLATVSNELIRKIDENQSIVADLQKRLAMSQQDFQKLQSEVAEQAQNFSSLQNKELGNREQWSVSEAQYLVKLANDNLQVGNNVPLIISLLQNADARLRDSNDPRLVPVRKALADDIAAFQAVPVVDVAGLYLKLSALNGEVDKLALPNHKPIINEEIQQQKHLPWWRRGLQQTWSSLKEIIVVRYTPAGEMPFVSPSQQDFLYQNLHAKYEQAMLALLNKQQDIYRNSLQQTQDWIAKYFLQDDSATQAQLVSLKELQSAAINPSLPTLTKTLDAFHDFMAAQQSNVKA